MPGEGGTRWLISIMSGHDRRGHWRVGPKVFNFNFWGGSYIDLNDAVLSAQQTEIRIISIMGGADVYVPEGLDVRGVGVRVHGWQRHPARPRPSGIQEGRPSTCGSYR